MPAFLFPRAKLVLFVELSLHNARRNVKTHRQITFINNSTDNPMLLPHYYTGLVEAGCDEAGRGCLAGSVYAAAVILPPDYDNPAFNDSKQLSRRARYQLRSEIERDAVAWAVGVVSPDEIDQMNILNASILAMHRAIDRLGVRPEALIIDGNRFKPYCPLPATPAEGRRGFVLPLESAPPLPHATIVKGDGKYQSIAAASILAKTWRDDYMEALAQEFPMYDWQNNMGYPTKKHREGIERHGLTPYHRRSFRLGR